MRRGTTTLTVVMVLGLVLATTHPALASVSIKQVSVTRRGGDPAGGGTYSSVSANGRYVAFTSRAGGDLVADDHTNQLLEVFVRDVVNGTTVRASVDAGDGDPDGDSSGPSISADGRYVAFVSFASDLVQGDRNGTYDVFVRALVSWTVRASVDLLGGDPNKYSVFPSISADGRFVAFQSAAGDLVAGDHTNHTPDVFVRDMLTGTTVRASVDTQGDDPDGESNWPRSVATGGTCPLSPTPETSCWDSAIRAPMCSSLGGEGERGSYRSEMEILSLTERDWLHVAEFENAGAYAASVAFGSGEAHVRLLRLDAGGWIEPHEAGFGQLFVPIDGSGWVSEGSQKAAIRVGQAAYLGRGVIQAKGSQTGMTALLIQADELDLGGTV